MDGVYYIVSADGRRKAVVIDLEHYLDAWERIQEILDNHVPQDGRLFNGEMAKVIADAESKPSLPLTALSGTARRLFASPDEVDAFINAERDAWER